MANGFRIGVWVLLAACLVGCYRVKVARPATCSDEITVRDNQLLEKNDQDAPAPWSEAEIWTKG